MCDTLGFHNSFGSFFAKNSDRSPNEPQVLEFYKAESGLSGEEKLTYISVPRAKETNAVLLSRPTWMWGAEIGVNEHGVCIGNEAVFTKGKYSKSGLTGMDLLRLALERADSAKGAVEAIITLLEQYGQGGNCGFDHDFYYDNSFLVMDRDEIFVLETMAKKWVYKKYDSVSISNRLSIEADGDCYSGGEAYNFKKKYIDPLYSHFSGSKDRKAQTGCCLEKASGIADCMSALRVHEPSVSNPFAKGSVGSACMHFGSLVGDHTTASMAISLEKDRTIVWSTGCSVPCVSLFKPWLFGSEEILPVVTPGSDDGRKYWLSQEEFRRSLIGKALPREYYCERDSLESAWLARVAKAGNAEMNEISRKCLEEEKAFFDKWKTQKLDSAKASSSFLKKWEQKNAALEK